MAVAIQASANDFAETIIMPGDPLRAKFIAEHYLSQAREVNSVRNMLGYTGEYKGKPLSVMAHGMGIPSISMYAYELIQDFGVKNLIRIGTCGAVRDDVSLMDVVIAMGASTDSKVNRDRFYGNDLAALADWHLLSSAVKTAERLQLPVKTGNVFTADLFYTTRPELFAVMEQYGILGVDMEVAGLYTVAAELGAKALAILTTSDHIKNGGKLTIDQRQNAMHNMIELALETALTL
ncbi:purine-nucleoside phosphorylase [Morganella morganii]|uniref:purine-nucleoside phosphorylase n=1 Tax=Morganella morganii TaxID=582 RepID=UPI003EC09050